MNFERGKDTKEALGVGIAHQTLTVGWANFHIGIYNHEKKRHNSIYDLKINLKDPYDKSLHGVLSEVSNPSPSLAGVLQFTNLKNKRDKRSLRHYRREKRTLIILMEFGTSYIPGLGPDYLEGIRYIKFQDVIYPIGDIRIELEYPPYQTLLQRISAKILGSFSKMGLTPQGKLYTPQPQKGPNPPLGFNENRAVTTNGRSKILHSAH